MAALAAAEPVRPDLRLAGDRSLREWVEGLACVVASVVTFAALVEAPTLPTRGHAVGRFALLVTAVAGWVMNAAGVWKLGRIDGGVDHHPIVPTLMRAAAATYVLLPVAVLANLNWPGVVYEGGAGLVLVLGVALIATAHARLGQLSSAAGRRVLTIVCALAVLVTPAVTLLAWSGPWQMYDAPSLEILEQLPLAADGPVFIIVSELDRAIRLGNVRGIIICALLAGDVCLFGMVLWHVATRVAARRSTVPSSRP